MLNSYQWLDFSNTMQYSNTVVCYSYFRLSENKTINVFPIDNIVQLSKMTSQ